MGVGGQVSGSEVIENPWKENGGTKDYMCEREWLCSLQRMETQLEFFTQDTCFCYLIIDYNTVNKLNGTK